MNRTDRGVVTIALALVCGGCAASGRADSAPMVRVDADADLLQRLAVREAVDRMSDAINHHEWDRVGAMLTDDAVWEAEPPVDWKLEGRAEIVGFLSKNASKVEVLSYGVAGTAVHIEGRGRASARSTMTELLRLRETETGLQIVGTYTDALARDDGVWRFSRRTFRIRYEDDAALPKRLRGQGGTRAPGTKESP